MRRGLGGGRFPPIPSGHDAVHGFSQTDLDVAPTFISTGPPQQRAG